MFAIDILECLQKAHIFKSSTIAWFASQIIQLSGNSIVFDFLFNQLIDLIRLTS